MIKHSMPSRIQFDQDAESAVQDVFAYYRQLKSDFGSKGHFEKLYAAEFVKFLDVPGKAEVVCSGTAALFVALQSLQLPTGSEVLVSPITDPGMISPIILLGHKVKLLDNAPDSFHPSLDSILERVTTDTKCLVLNHYSGKPIPDIKRICEWATDNKIKVIEDCSQAHGAKVSGSFVGTFADISCFSTMYSKTHSTGGQGGVCFTKDEGTYDRIRMCSSKGKPYHKADFNEKNPATFEMPALNLNLNEISCSIGVATLKKVSTVNRRRLNFLQRLEKSLLELPIKTKMVSASETDAPFFSIFYAPQMSKSEKINFAQILMREGLTLNPNYQYVVDEWPWVRPYLTDSFRTENARALRDSTFHLLFNENYGTDEVHFICDSLIKAEGQYGR